MADVKRRNGDVGGAAGNGAGTGAGANLPALRSYNAALVLDLLRAAGDGGISRLELAERTGLTPQAVSKITARLRTEGMATEAGRRASTGGKPRTVLRLVPTAAYAVGLHLDRDELTAVLVDLSGALVAVRTAPLDLGAGAERVVEAAAVHVDAVRAEALRAGSVRAECVRASARYGVRRDARPSGRAGAGSGSGAGAWPDEVPGVREPGARAVAVSGTWADGRPGVRDVLGVGVAMPGPLDHRTGVPGRVTGFPQWAGFPLREALAARLQLPVVLDKDTNAAALGLALRGSGDSFAYLHLGTGLGAGLVLGGALHRGARTGAGEFGHQVIQLDGPPCDCGNRGCIEALCLAAVARGEPAEAARVLGAGAANLVGLLDIDRVLLGGRTIAAHEECFVQGVGTVVAERARGAVVPVTAADGGPYPVAEGAAQLVLAPVFGHRRALELG
ncbi:MULTISPECIES: ROK family transcriptional regulator [unclassified Streptomyces]|uniref:ROK family transcriptional regulator n=1 Tax=unclassified Streptomyces TaxID=2593676 RepID=UPI00081DB155|nr:MULTISPECIES: ROK family transcriptional regulator [unclassified Streptomyces]MYZ38403.1 ROK family protein [Streptomyces sp. SID4917]SCF98284.1 Sugar kinase of the NBD/HSP70 family, may contain an N-terminal HTH domain [Streptomyces sp. MnatMP-M17]